jgi:hypothetical protein
MNPGTLQALQRPQGPDEQHTPSVQWPVVHWAPLVQAAPWGFNRQAPPTHELGAVQSASTVQLVLHTPPVQTYAPHSIEVLGGTQAPVPLQVDAGTAVFALQAAGTHTVPAVCLRQAPAPSH